MATFAGTLPGKDDATMTTHQAEGASDIHAHVATAEGLLSGSARARTTR